MNVLEIFDLIMTFVALLERPTLASRVSLFLLGHFQANKSEGSASSNFDSSLRLMSCIFVSNFEAISHAIFVLKPKNHPKSLA